MTTIADEITIHERLIARLKEIPQTDATARLLKRERATLARLKKQRKSKSDDSVE